MKVLQRDIKLKGKPFLEKHGIKYDLSNYQMDAVLKAGDYKFWYDDDEGRFFTNAPKFKDKGYLSIVELLANVFDIDCEEKKFVLESNSERRAFTKQKKEDITINQKEKTSPHVAIIIDNDATKKLVKIWEKKGYFLKKGDSIGKLKLEPTSKGYGGFGVYGVWEAVRGLSELYADFKIVNGEKWSFTELWLDKKGVEKIKNNIIPSNDDFRRGKQLAYLSYKEKRRTNALKDKNKTGDSKLKKDIIDYKNDIGSKEDFHKNHPDIRPYNFSQGETKKQKKTEEIYNYISKIVKPLEKRLDAEAKDIYWKAMDITKIKDVNKRAQEITKLKKEVSDYMKNNKETTYFNY